MPARPLALLVACTLDVKSGNSPLMGPAQSPWDGREQGMLTCNNQASLISMHSTLSELENPMMTPEASAVVAGGGVQAAGVREQEDEGIMDYLDWNAFRVPQPTASETAAAAGLPPGPTSVLDPNSVSAVPTESVEGSGGSEQLLSEESKAMVMAVEMGLESRQQLSAQLITFLEDLQGARQWRRRP